MLVACLHSPNVIVTAFESADVVSWRNFTVFYLHALYCPTNIKLSPFFFTPHDSL